MRGLDALLNGSKVGRQVMDVIDDAKAVMPQKTDVISPMAQGRSHDAQSILDETDIDSHAKPMTQAVHTANNESADHVANQQTAGAEQAVALQANDLIQTNTDAQSEDDKSPSNVQSVAESSMDNDDTASDALSSLAQHQQREVLLFWQYGLSMAHET